MKRSFKITLLGTCSLVLYFAVGLHVSKDLTSSDIKAVESLTGTDSCLGDKKSYKSQLNCIRAVQSSIQSIGSDDCSSSVAKVEPHALLERGYGCCYDKARAIEKALIYYGFSTRRVFLLQNIEENPIHNFLPLNQQSHAVSEVLTMRGWLGVDSTEPYILLDDDDLPLTYRDAIADREYRERLVPVHFYRHSIAVINGLYSRHGFFHGLDLPGPEVNVAEFVSNF